MKIVNETLFFDSIKEIWTNAIDYGFEWESAEQIFEHMKSEWDEIQDAIKMPNARENLVLEVGDLIHCAFSIAHYLGVDPKKAMAAHLVKYNRRFKVFRNCVEAAGLRDLKGLSYETKLEFWNQAKHLVG